MTKPNREAGSALPETIQKESQKKTEKLSHADQALEKEKQEWDNSDLNRLLVKVKDVSAEEREKFEFILAELEAATNLSPREREEKQRQIENYQKRSQERFELISKLQKVQHLRAKYSLYSGSIGDWMELFAEIARVDFHYSTKTSLLKQFEMLKKSLPPEIYKDLDAQSSELMQKAEEVRVEYDKNIKELETTANVYLAEELDRQGFWADQLPQ